MNFDIRPPARPPRPIVILNGQWVNCRYMKMDVTTDPQVPMEALLRAGFAIEGVKVTAGILLERMDGVMLQFEPDGVEVSVRPSGRPVFRFRNKRGVEVLPRVAVEIMD